MKNRAWLFLLPALILVAMNSLLPLMTVINYSLHDLVPGQTPRYVGLKNYQTVLQVPQQVAPPVVNDDPYAIYDCQATTGSSMATDFSKAVGRQFHFTFLILLIEIPLGLAIALCLPRRGWKLTLSLVLLGIPLLIPWNVVGMVWRVFTRSDLGVVAPLIQFLGGDYRPVEHIHDAWWTVVAMDVWHWTPLVVLLCFAGLKTIPEPYFRAAEIDGASRWSVFWHVILPRLKYVLVLSVLLRAMDSFNIYTEPFIVTGGGPGTTTTFMSVYLKSILDDKAQLAAVSMIYLFIVVMLCYVLATIMQNLGRSGARP